VTLEERVTRLEQRTDQFDRIENAITGLRSDFNAYRRDNALILERILASIEALNRRPSFHWPWERAA
jgi:hypothetical protein